MPPQYHRGRRLRPMQEPGDDSARRVLRAGPPAPGRRLARRVPRAARATARRDGRLVEPFDAAKVARARLVAISVPMHTALRLGVGIAERVRAINPAATSASTASTRRSTPTGCSPRAPIPCWRARSSPSWSSSRRALERGRRPARGAVIAPRLAKLVALPRARAAAALPSLKKYAHLERDGRLELTGYVEASRGCKHLCRHCPIPPGVRRPLLRRPRGDVCSADVRQLVEAGAAPHHVRRSRLPQRPRPCDGGRARGCTPSSRTSPSTSRPRSSTCSVTAAAAGAGGARLRLHRLGGGVAERHGARPPRQGPHARRLRRGARAGARGRARAASDLGRVHAVDDARRLPRAAGVRRDRKDWSTTSTRSSLDPAAGPSRLAARSKVPRCARTWAPSSQDAFHYRWTHPDPRMDALQADVSAPSSRTRPAEPRTRALTFARIRRARGSRPPARPARR